MSKPMSNAAILSTFLVLVPGLAAAGAACPAAFDLGNCSTFVPPLAVDGVCLVDQIQRCADAAAARAGFMDCLAPLEHKLEPADFAGVMVCAGMVPDAAFFGGKGCKNKVKKAEVEGESVDFTVCAKDNKEAATLAKAGAQAAATADAVKACKLILDCENQQAACTNQKRPDCLQETNVSKFAITADPTCTATTQQCPPQQPPHVIFNCTLTADYNFDCKCACGKKL